MLTAQGARQWFRDIPDDMAAVMTQEHIVTKYIWDPSSPEEVNDARHHFRALQKRGLSTYKLVVCHPKSGEGSFRIRPDSPVELVEVHAPDPNVTRYVALPH